MYSKTSHVAKTNLYIYKSLLKVPTEQGLFNLNQTISTFQLTLAKFIKLVTRPLLLEHIGTKGYSDD